MSEVNCSSTTGTKRRRKSLISTFIGANLLGGGASKSNNTKSTKKWLNLKFSTMCTRKPPPTPPPLPPPLPSTGDDVTDSDTVVHTCCKCKALEGAIVGEEPSPEEALPSTEQSNDNEQEAGGPEEGENSRRQANLEIYSAANNPQGIVINAPFLDLQWVRPIIHHEDCDEAARLARAREIEQGVEAPANFRPIRRVQLVCSSNSTAEEVGQQVSPPSPPPPPSNEQQAAPIPRCLRLVYPPDVNVDSLRILFQNNVTLRSCPLIDKYNTSSACHTQVDFIHCLVPDLRRITSASFYWGKMNRFEAEKLLDGQREGTFLLRDSAQEDHLFSVSFRKYGRSLHARIEQWNHKFSFDAHDPGVFTSDTVCGLLEHYKDPSGCMFFEPVLTWPFLRNTVFTLQSLCRSVIVDRLQYDDINSLHLPKTLKTYLKEYHYRQKVRVKRFDDDVIELLDVRN